jgi:hypothetical protein
MGNILSKFIECCCCCCAPCMKEKCLLYDDNDDKYKYLSKAYSDDRVFYDSIF